MKYFYLLLSICIFNISVFVLSICLHDNRIMRRKMERIEQIQLKQAQEIREIKTDSDAAFNIAIHGDISKGAK